MPLDKRKVLLIGKNYKGSKGESGYKGSPQIKSWAVTYTWMPGICHNERKIVKQERFLNWPWYKTAMRTSRVWVLMNVA